MPLQNSEEICLKLIRAESEDEVSAIITEYDCFKSEDNWAFIDDRATNFNIIGNQTADAAKALTELMTNTGDAILMKLAYENGIEPNHEHSPKSMEEARKRFVPEIFNEQGKLDENKCKEYAKNNLIIGVTGQGIAGNKIDKNVKINFTIVDNGEGQNAENFSTTFLSTSISPKKDIPFLQGVQGMGGQAVLQFCGKKMFKLIVSRRFDNKNGKWGWTLIRKHRSREKDRTGWEYFAFEKNPINQTFFCNSILPFKTRNHGEYKEINIDSGTIIKLYDYYIGDITSHFDGILNRLNENLVETILPFQLTEFRVRPLEKKGKKREMEVMNRTLSGLAGNLDQIKLGEMEIGRITDEELGEISISAVKLKPGVSNKGALRDMKFRIFHHVNGQVHNKEKRGYLTRCNLPTLKDRVLIFVNASKLHSDVHDSVWQGDRERIAGTRLGDDYQAKIIETIKDSQALIEFAQEVYLDERDSISNSLHKETFQKLLDSDAVFANFFGGKKRRLVVPKPESGPMVGVGKFVGVDSPTFLNLPQNLVQNGKDVPSNSYVWVEGETDANNGYFKDREGKVLISPSFTKYFTVTESLKDGKLRLKFEPNSLASIGQSFELNIKLEDPMMLSSGRVVESQNFEIRIADKQQKTTNIGGKNTPRTAGGDQETVTATPEPLVELLTECGREINGIPTIPWGEEWNEHDGGGVFDLNEKEKKFYVNYDNVTHLEYRNKEKDTVAKDVVTEKFKTGMVIAMATYELVLQQNKEIENQVDGELDLLRREFARATAKNVLMLSHSMPNIIGKKYIEESDEE